MEDKIEVVGVDGDLVRDFVLLEVEEVFKELLFLRLVIFLSDKALVSTDLVVAKNRSMHDLLQDKLVARVPHLVVNLAKVQTREQAV